MPGLSGLIEQRLAALALPVALEWPGGRVGTDSAPLKLRLNEPRWLGALARGQIGDLADAYVRGQVDIDGDMRTLMSVAAELVGDPTEPRSVSPWRRWALHWLSGHRHRPERDARQIQFHYDVSDDFYALWLDERRVYSCAYFADPAMSLTQAQEAKLDHICRKLQLQRGQRFLDIGAGWGGLLIWAAERYGVQATGITLSRNQHAHVNRLIQERGLQDRVTMHLMDYRDLPEDAPYDRIASVGMFEHVGRANLGGYFGKIRALLRPGGLVMNHGITAGGLHNAQLGGGMGDFIERYIFPGGELEHVSEVTAALSGAGLELLDAENLRPHYARTLWAWSDGLEGRLDRARQLTNEQTVRAYRLYLAGCAMSFERGWISLFQLLCSRPSAEVASGPLRGAQSDYPFNRTHMYR